jgi:hypothetical protein
VKWPAPWRNHAGVAGGAWMARDARSSASRTPSCRSGQHPHLSPHPYLSPQRVASGAGCGPVGHLPHPQRVLVAPLAAPLRLVNCPRREPPFLAVKVRSPRGHPKAARGTGSRWENAKGA